MKELFPDIEGQIKYIEHQGKKISQPHFFFLKLDKVKKKLINVATVAAMRAETRFLKGEIKRNGDDLQKIQKAMDAREPKKSR